MNELIPDAETLYAKLLQGVRGLCGPHTRLAGIASGGAWLAERLHADLALPRETLNHSSSQAETAVRDGLLGAKRSNSGAIASICNDTDHPNPQFPAARGIVQRFLGSVGVLSSSLHRDDFASRGLASSAHTTLPFEVNDADIVLIDDVLHTGRTTRAVLNELFDYGRPARVRLAVLVERMGRELPIAAEFAASRLSLPNTQLLVLTRNAHGHLHFEVQEV